MTLPDIDQLWDYPDPAGSERRFRDALPAAESSGDDAYRAELLTQLARAVCLQRRYDDAGALVDDAFALLDGLGAAATRPRIRCLLERGRITNDRGRTEEALGLFVRAWEIAEHTPHRVLAADALHMIGYVTRGEESVRWHRVAIEFCEKSEGERFRRWLCTLHMNLADNYEELGRYDLGVESVERSLGIAEELSWPERVRHARCFLARLGRLSGDVPGAMAILDSLLEEESPGGYVLEEYGECLLAFAREEEARPYFRRAFALHSTDPWYPPTETGRLARIERLGGSA